MIYAVLIFYISSLGPEGIPVKPLFPNQDKVIHFAEYIPFGWLSLKAFMPVTPFGFVASMGFSLIYAASDEVHQSFVPGREMSVMDWMADAMGILVSGYVYYSRIFRPKGFAAK